MANRRAVSRRAPKRRTKWEGAIVDISDLDASPAITTPIIAESLLESDPNSTIVRIRGNLICWNDSTSNAGAMATVGVGIFLADIAQVTVGISAMPLPFGAIGSDWLYWDAFTVGEQVTNQADANGLSFDRHIVDNKAMRKVKSNQQLQMVTELATAEGTPVVNISGVLRVLLMLA